MPKRAALMTARQAETIRKPGFHAAGGVSGLYLQVTAGAGRSWVFRFSFGGRRRDMGLGSFEVIGLAEAREMAAAARRQILAGTDPVEQRRGARDQARLDAAKAMTFREAAERYIAAHEAAWRSVHARQWPTTLATHVYPVLGRLPIGAIDTALVMKTLEPIWHEKTETANRVRSRVEAVLDWAAARGYRSGENPARWRGHIANLLPRRSKVQPVIHYAALPYRELGGFVAELRQREGIAARALEFLVLTASRTSEVLGARWDEIDMAARLWTIPGKRMKSAREHRVPLSQAAMAIVEKMAAIRSSEYIFPGRNGALGPVTLRRALAATGRRDLTTHGFRSSFRDWCAELTQFPHEVAEMALAHAVGNEVERAYRRGDLFEKRRQLADAWAKFCAAPIVAGEVVSIRASTPRTRGAKIS
jgi:integrase